MGRITIFLSTGIPHSNSRRCVSRLQNSERERRQSDQTDRDMRSELEGKVHALQKQLGDLDTLRYGHTHTRTHTHMHVPILTPVP